MTHSCSKPPSTHKISIPYVAESTMDSKLTQGDVLDDVGVTIRVEYRASTQSSLFVTANSTKITHLGNASPFVAGICCEIDTKASHKETLCPSTVDYSSSSGGVCLPSTTSSLVGRCVDSRRSRSTLSRSRPTS